MALSEELAFNVKRFIVQRLACYETPNQVAKAVKEEFQLEVSRQRVHFYDPTAKAGAALMPELKELFDTTRKAFLEEIGNIPIANKAVRLRALNKQLEFFGEKNAAGIVKDLCEAAAKEMGNAFTNRREFSGPNGGPIETKASAQALTDEQLETIARGGSAGADATPAGAKQSG
jgi:hypothetical protein